MELLFMQTEERFQLKDFPRFNQPVTDGFCGRLSLLKLNIHDQYALSFNKPSRPQNRLTANDFDKFLYFFKKHN